MTNYESVYILDPDLPAETTKSVITQFQDLISKNQGRIDGMQEWGKKRLAYKIRKKTDGYYVIVNFQLDPSQIKKIEQSLRLNDNVMRFLIISKDAL